LRKDYVNYKGNEKVSPLLTQLNWSNHLKIMSAYLKMTEDDISDDFSKMQIATLNENRGEEQWEQAS